MKFQKYIINLFYLSIKTIFFDMPGQRIRVEGRPAMLYNKNEPENQK